MADFLVRSTRNRYDKTLRAFTCGLTDRGSTRLYMSGDDKSLFSYGPHYVLARHGGEGFDTIILINRRKSSNTTERQKLRLREHICGFARVGVMVEGLDQHTPTRDLIARTVTHIGENDLPEACATLALKRSPRLYRERYTTVRSLLAERARLEGLLQGRFVAFDVTDVDVERAIAACLPADVHVRLLGRLMTWRMEGVDWRTNE